MGTADSQGVAGARYRRPYAARDGRPTERRCRPEHRPAAPRGVPELTAAIVAVLEAAGYKVSVIMSAEMFIRLSLANPEGAEEKVELAVDWRAHDPRSACR
jgi:hypothetical protein